MEMGPLPKVLFFISLLGCLMPCFQAADSSEGSFSFSDNFDIMWAEDHFKTSEDGQVWYLTLDKKTGEKSKQNV